MLYRKLNIEQVPAIAYVNGNLTSEDVGQGNHMSIPYYVVYGDVALEGALATFAEKTNSVSLKAMIDKLREVN